MTLETRSHWKMLPRVINASQFSQNFEFWVLPPFTVVCQTEYAELIFKTTLMHMECI